MLKGHPRGLYVAFFANMGERFGFYTMMAILVLFLQAKFNLSADDAGYIYSVFYFLIYALALVGGLIADRTRNYKGTIMTGIVTMLAGYLIMSAPGMGLTVTLIGLFVIALGNGLFKGNLQALVGQLYDAPQYSHLRDRAFSIFYMGINIGAFLAPSAAIGMRNWFLKTQGFGYDADLPGLCHNYLNGVTKSEALFRELASKAAGSEVTDLTAFANDYISAFSTGYNYSFAVAAGGMVVSMIIYTIFKKMLPDAKKQAEAAQGVVQMPWEEEKKRLIALGLVFFVVIFFWMSFHQNGLTLTLFAKDYTAKAVDNVSFLLFDLKGMLSIIAAIMGLVLLVSKGAKTATRGIGAALSVLGIYATIHFFNGYPAVNGIEPEIFQQFNPIFIVFLTPVVVAAFGWLNVKGIEPSTPRKIGIGMLLAAAGYLLMVFASKGLLSPHELAGEPSPDRVSPYWLISNYLILTVAELFLSPMGISFVSKVSPPRFQGLMQGGWLGATAVGNQLLFVGTLLWSRTPIWIVWAVFVSCCLVSAAFIFSIMKRLENATQSKPADTKDIKTTDE